MSVMKMNKLKTAVLCLFLTGGGCTAKAPEPVRYSNMSVDAGFDTVLTYTELSYDTEKMKANFETAVNIFSSCNDQFDIYNDYPELNNLKTVNDNAGKQPVKVSSEIIAMLKEARDFYDLSGGAFDVTIGSLLQVWHRYREEGVQANTANTPAAVPSEAELLDASSHRGWENIEIDEANSTVFIKDPRMSLDVGGIAKGYAAEVMGKRLDENVEGCANINAGGNIRTIHAKADGSPWNIGIQNPDGDSRTIIVSVSGTSSFVTSGDYERFYVGEDGRKYHHIVDPSTMYPADRYRSVSIVTEDSSAADALSTTLFTLSIEDGRRVLQLYSEKSGKQADALWLMDPDKAPSDAKELGDLRFTYTQGLEGKLTY